MTVDRSLLSSELGRVDRAHAGPDEVDAVSDAYFASLESGRVDRIALSSRARALIAAGLAVRAFVIGRLEELRQRVAIGWGRWLVLESGIYGIGR